jgi:hypothetical protein
MSAPWEENFDKYVHPVKDDGTLGVRPLKIGFERIKQGTSRMRRFLRMVDGLKNPARRQDG